MFLTTGCQRRFSTRTLWWRIVTDDDNAHVLWEIPMAPPPIWHIKRPRGISKAPHVSSRGSWWSTMHRRWYTCVWRRNNLPRSRERSRPPSCRTYGVLLLKEHKIKPEQTAVQAKTSQIHGQRHNWSRNASRPRQDSSNLSNGPTSANRSHFKLMQVKKAWAVPSFSQIVKDASHLYHTHQTASMQQSNDTPKLKKTAWPFVMHLENLTTGSMANQT